MDELILAGKFLVGQQPVALRRYLNTRRAFLPQLFSVVTCIFPPASSHPLLLLRGHPELRGEASFLFNLNSASSANLFPTCPSTSFIIT